ncbi:MAG: hypothetical protein U0871_17845 [Gemmataceae bacterium]
MRALVAVAVGLAAVGCGSDTGGVGAGLDPQEALLREVGDLLRTGERPPTKLADLTRFESNFPRAYQAIKAGDVVVLWNTPMLGEGDAAKGGGAPVAYEKAAPTAGGWALLASGQVKKLAASEIPAGKK